MSYPQDPNNPYGQPEQNPYGQGAPNQNPYAQPGQNPYAQPQAGGLFDSAGNPAPFGQQPQNPYGQPQAGPYDGGINAAPTQLFGQQPDQNPYGQAPSPYAQPANPYDASGGQIPQAYGQQQQYGMPPNYPQQQPFYGQQPPAKSGNNGMMVGIAAVVVVALAAGGYFLLGTKKNPGPSPLTPLIASQSVLPTAGTSGSPAASGGPVTQNGNFTPPTTYSSDSLDSDNGCGDFAGDEVDFLTATIDLNTNADATTAFTKLAAGEKTASADSQDPTLRAALAAESTYITANEAALSAGMVSYNSLDDGSSTQFAAAFKGIQSTDEYINGVCGLASWAPTEP
ncbi:MAG TPA: hypothetical protein VGX23_04075 [Actinocrinis sp.]|nr:hypothetical protein [Actinocrinis sp.]